MASRKTKTSKKPTSKNATAKKPTSKSRTSKKPTSKHTASKRPTSHRATSKSPNPKTPPPKKSLTSKTPTSNSPNSPPPPLITSPLPKKSLIKTPLQVRGHSSELIRAFAPIRFFLIIIGQMPFDIKKKKDNTYTFKLNTRGFSWFFFLLMFTITTSFYILVTVGIVSFIFTRITKDWIHPNHQIVAKNPVTGENEAQLWERHYTRKEMIPIIVIWSWMTIAFFGSLHVILYGKFYVHYMNYFNRVVQMMDIDMTYGVKNYLWKNIILLLAIAAALIVGLCMQVFNFHPIANMANVLANFVLRMFGVEIQDLTPNKKIGCQVFGIIIMCVSLVGSRANVIQFLFFSQLLKNGSKVWNQRFTIALEIDQSQLKKKGYLEDTGADQFHRRLDLKHILKDHLILVQLFRMTEAVFGFILLSYYFFEIISVVMEIYQLAALGGFKETLPSNDTAGFKEKDDLVKDKIRKDEFESDKIEEWDIFSTAVVAIVLMTQHVWFAITTTTDAAAAYEQAMEGFNILRQHGFMYCRNKADRNFVLSMFMSYSKSTPMQLSAGGYFVINKALLVAMSAAIVLWAVSIYQTKIDQWD